MLATHFRRFLVLCMVVGLVTAVSVLTAQATPPRQEDRPSRTNIEDTPHYPLAETPEAGLALESVTVVPASKVAFQSYRSGNWDIFVGNDDGTGQTAVTSHIRADIHPHLNRGATQVVYASRADDHDYEIYKVNVNGSNNTPLTNNQADDGNPMWSPDGTKIVFESYRDGQAEIYVMNADGGSQVRLTHHGAFDGMPSWSPDGSKIAFSSTRSGAYRIWVMNADGSNPVQLSTIAFSFRPQWSPDGSKIAFDADGDNDGWQELWVMNADGSGQQQKYRAHNSYTDIWAGSWSPDGRYIAFTRIRFIYYQGNWYWEYAYQDAIDASAPTTIRLSQSDLDWNPRWQTSDGQPPVSQVHALGAQSPGSIPVSWSGTDTGGSGGIAWYDVQVKIGANGNWTNWLMGTTEVSAHYLGIGGNTYYFRVRAYDKHFSIENWPHSHDAATTVEALPPQSYVNVLPAFSRYDDNLAVKWSGYDPGGSGIATYDVQYQVNNGSWLNWMMGTLVTTAFLPGGNSGETYSFRVRARDHAQNVANWPANGDASTTFYAWGIHGSAYDNSHTPVEGITVNTSPSFMEQLPAQLDGTYGVLFKDSLDSYTASWVKTGYGSLPETVYPGGPNALVDVVLPPADNVIANWGFEEGFSSWNIAGSIVPVITNSIKHSGSQAAFLGQPNSGFAPAFRLSHEEYSYPVSIVADSKGRIHILWVVAQQSGFLVYYASRDMNGNWTTAEALSHNYTGSNAQLIIDANDTLHATWTDSGRNYYARKPQNGNWSSLEDITVMSNSFSSDGATIVVSPQGLVHAFIPAYTSETFQFDYYYRQRLTNGTWSNAQLVGNTYGNGFNLKLLLDHHGNLHAVWEDGTASGYTSVFYIQRLSMGEWSPLMNLSGESWGSHAISPDFVVDVDSTLHLIWVQNGIYYRQKPLNEDWLAAELLFQNVGINPRLALAQDGRIHMVWVTQSYHIHYARRAVNGIWSGAYLLSAGLVNSGQPQILTDAANFVHVVWGSIGPNALEQDVYYTQNLSDDTWSTPLNLSNSNSTTLVPLFTLDSGGYVHVIWEERKDGDSGFYYAGPQLVESNGEAILSQTITIPVTSTTSSLSFLYQSIGIYPISGTRFLVTIDDGTVTELPIAASSLGRWTHYSASLSDWVGLAVTFTLKLEQAALTPAASVFIDEVTVGTTYSDNWVNINDANALPSQQFVQALTYGNRGGAAASGLTLTYTLPAGVTFVSASVPPVSTNPLVWHLPDLPAKSEPFEILVTARVNASTPVFSTLTSTAVITTDDTELELLNNQAIGQIYTAARLYLPIAFR